MKTEKENIQAELSEAEILANEGLNYKAGWFRFHIKPLTFGVIAKANIQALKLKLNLIDDDQKTLIENYQENINPLINFIAICTLGNLCRITPLVYLLSYYLKWKLTPKEVIGLCIFILKMYDLGNFTTTIRLIGTSTITMNRVSPNPIVNGEQ